MKIADLELSCNFWCSPRLPSAALSYRQALVDISDIRRQSFRGPAAELRAAMREVVDKLAPDEDVMVADGFKLEKDRTEPDDTAKDAVHSQKPAKLVSRSGHSEGYDCSR